MEEKKEEEKSSKMKTFKTVLSTIRDTTPCGSVSKTREWSARGELYPTLERVRAARKTFLIPAPVAARDAAAPFLFLLPSSSSSSSFCSFLMLPTSASFFLQPRQRLSDSQPRLLNNDRFKRVAEADPHTAASVSIRLDDLFAVYIQSSVGIPI